MKTKLAILIALCAATAFGKHCDTIAASAWGGWAPVATAPRDGTVIEMLETFGVAPWYSIFKWVKPGTWMDVNTPNMGVMEDSCLFWRPYKPSGGKYVDPTHGAQYTVAYQCAYMHFPYDKKKNACVAW